MWRLPWQILGQFSIEKQKWPAFHKASLWKRSIYVLREGIWRHNKYFYPWLRKKYTDGFDNWVIFEHDITATVRVTKSMRNRFDRHFKFIDKILSHFKERLIILRHWNSVQMLKAVGKLLRVLKFWYDTDPFVIVNIF